MEKQDLDRAFRRGIAIQFLNKKEYHMFLDDMKKIGAMWCDLSKISSEDYLDENFPTNKLIYVDKMYVLSYIDDVCYNFAAIPTVKYSKFASDKLIEVTPLKKNF